MELEEKLKLLSTSVHLDQVCGLSSLHQRLQNLTPQKGPIYHSLAGGQRVPLLKILLSNRCEFNCSYCANKKDFDFPRTSLEPDELAKLTVELFQKKIIQGLFLSSAVDRSPNYTMERMLWVARKLRLYYKFPGYIHLKIIPGSDRDLLREALKYASRVSINLEFPTQRSLELFAPNKKPEYLLKPLQGLSRLLQTQRKVATKGLSTQFIVGASKESDSTLLKVANTLYQQYGLKRVYYSAFVPVLTPHNFELPARKTLLREHRLYQADWLIRCYGFSWEELFSSSPNLDFHLDPKTSWALNHLELFPVEINRASFKELLRIPGIGQKGARQIINLRKQGNLGWEELEKMALNLSKAKYFITVKGRYFCSHFEPGRIKRFLRKERVNFLPLN